jgi:hypothetical protein
VVAGVETVRGPFCAVVPVMAIEGVTAQVAGLTAPVGIVVTAQVRPTDPVNPFEGVTVIVDVFPVVALASTLMLPLLVRPKLGVGAAVTVTVFVPVALL